MLVSVSAVAVLWLRRRSLLDQWLMIVALAAILEIGTRRHVRQRALQPRLLCRPPVFAAHLDDRPGRSAGGDDAALRQLARAQRNTGTASSSRDARARCARRRKFATWWMPTFLGICIWNIDGAIVSKPTKSFCACCNTAKTMLLRVACAGSISRHPSGASKAEDAQ